jgi:hypothetical protein
MSCVDKRNNAHDTHIKCEMHMHTYSLSIFFSTWTVVYTIAIIERQHSAAFGGLAGCIGNGVGFD